MNETKIQSLKLAIDYCTGNNLGDSKFLIKVAERIENYLNG